MIKKKDIKMIQSNELENCFSFWDFKNNSEKRNKIEREIADEKRIMYVCILDGEYVAGMSLQQFENDTVYLSYLAVKEDCRNHGIGTEMIKSAFKLSQENGNRFVKLNVDYDNLNAKKLYEKLGFVEIEKNSCGRIEMIKDLRTEQTKRTPSQCSFCL